MEQAKLAWDRLVSLLGLFWQLLLGKPEPLPTIARGPLIKKLTAHELLRLKNYLCEKEYLEKSDDDDMFLLYDFIADATALVSNEAEAAALVEVVFDLTASERKELLQLAMEAMKKRRMTMPIPVAPKDIPPGAERWSVPPGAGSTGTAASDQEGPDAVPTQPPPSPTATPRSAITPAPFVAAKAESMPGLPPAPTDLPELVIESDRPSRENDETSVQNLKICRSCGEANVMSVPACRKCGLHLSVAVPPLDETEDLVLPAKEAAGTEALVSDTKESEEAPAPDTTNVEPATTTPSLASEIPDENIVGSVSLPPAEEPEPARPSKTTSLDMGAVDITPLKQVLMSLHIYYERICKDNLKGIQRVPHPTVVTIGRNTLAKPVKVVSCDWDPRVSSMQAELELRPDGHAFLRDMNSTNGTFLNGVLVKELVEVWPGNRIKVGDTIIAVTLEEYFGDWTELPSLRVEPDHADFLDTDTPLPEGAKPEPIIAEPPALPSLPAVVGDGKEENTNDKNAPPQMAEPAFTPHVDPLGATTGVGQPDRAALAAEIFERDQKEQQAKREKVTQQADGKKKTPQQGDTKAQTAFDVPTGGPVPPLALSRSKSSGTVAALLAFVIVGYLSYLGYTKLAEECAVIKAAVLTSAQNAKPPVDPVTKCLNNWRKQVNDAPLADYISGKTVPNSADDCFPSGYTLSENAVRRCCMALAPEDVYEQIDCGKRATMLALRTLQ